MSGTKTKGARCVKLPKEWVAELNRPSGDLRKLK